MLTVHGLKYQQKHNVNFVINHHCRQSMVTGKQKNQDGVKSVCRYSREFEM